MKWPCGGPEPRNGHPGSRQVRAGATVRGVLRQRPRPNGGLGLAASRGLRAAFVEWQMGQGDQHVKTVLPPVVWPVIAAPNGACQRHVWQHDQRTALRSHRTLDNRNACTARPHSRRRLAICSRRTRSSSRFPEPFRRSVIVSRHSLRACESSGMVLPYQFTARPIRVSAARGPPGSSRTAHASPLSSRYSSPPCLLAMVRTIRATIGDDARNVKAPVALSRWPPWRSHSSSPWRSRNRCE